MAKRDRVIDISFLGKNLRKHREAQNLSMQDLANIAEIEKSQIARIETGESDPRLSTIMTIASALQISVEELLVR
ncbi:helix-turn-helix transcriptional regulator [Mucilaginibacter sp. PAMB04274]|uniref:helix-turn-helix domain-containing protein n=1 Tax=Mucilaginibacter sp. PAMB04274 TaxID=3138568 RepID=UPI0031F6E39F